MKMIATKTKRAAEITPRGEYVLLELVPRIRDILVPEHLQVGKKLIVRAVGCGSRSISGELVPIDALAPGDEVVLVPGLKIPALPRETCGGMEMALVPQESIMCVLRAAGEGTA